MAATSAGNAGAGLHGIPADPDQIPEIFAVAENRYYGYLVAEANATALRVEAVRSDGGGLLDEFVLVKPAFPAQQ